MTTETSTATSVVKAASKKAADAVAESLPTVIETTEIGLEIPTKVVVNKSLLIAVGAVAGAATAGAAYWGWTKFQEKRKANKAPDDISSLADVENK